jgi:replicative DNA helicase
MTAYQIINKVLATQDASIIKDNFLDVEYFIGYEEEYSYIMEHLEQYHNVPDKATFFAKFDTLEPIDVTESDRYLVDTIREEHLYWKSVPIIQKSAELLQTDANEAARYMLSQMQNLKPDYSISAKDIIKSAPERLATFESKADGTHPWYFSTGFEELDSVIHGWARGEELVVIFARTGQGKSWVLAKSLSHIWNLGFRVGYVSPEMSPIKLGYRVDTLLGGFSNKALVWGDPGDLSVDDYRNHINTLSQKDGFFVAQPSDFNKKITVSKLKAFCCKNKLDVLGVDGISYMTDERAQRGDNKTTMLTNISEDLMALSIELEIPILVVVQSNREGVRQDEGTPDLENIRDSDGIAQNATKVLALRQAGGSLEIGIKKHRDGITGGKINYYWDINYGQFTYVPAEEDAVPPKQREQKTQEVKQKFKGGKDVF